MDDYVYAMTMITVGLVVVALIGYAAFVRYEQKHAEKHADAIIYQTFTAGPVATYKIPRFGGSLSYDRIVAGGQIMGFQLVSKTKTFTGVTLTFHQAPIGLPQGVVGDGTVNRL